MTTISKFKALEIILNYKVNKSPYQSQNFKAIIDNARNLRNLELDGSDSTAIAVNSYFGYLVMKNDETLMEAIDAVTKLLESRKAFKLDKKFVTMAERDEPTFEGLFATECLCYLDHISDSKHQFYLTTFNNSPDRCLFKIYYKNKSYEDLVEVTQEAIDLAKEEDLKLYEAVARLYMLSLFE